MIKSLRNIETAYKQMRLVMLVFAIMTTCIIIAVMSYAFTMVRDNARTVYLVSNGAALKALASNIKDNRPAEARHHVARFHALFFTLDPDLKGIEANISQALNLADRSAKKQYDNLHESGYFHDLISANMSQDIEVDSVSVNFDTHPYYAKCYARQKITRSTSITWRNLISECYLRDVTRTDLNPNGFLIEKWRVLENNDLKTIVK